MNIFGVLYEVSSFDVFYSQSVEDIIYCGTV